MGKIHACHPQLFPEFPAFGSIPVPEGRRSHIIPQPLEWEIQGKDGHHENSSQTTGSKLLYLYKHWGNLIKLQGLVSCPSAHPSSAGFWLAPSRPFLALLLPHPCRIHQLPSSSADQASQIRCWLMSVLSMGPTEMLAMGMLWRYPSACCHD